MKTDEIRQKYLDFFASKGHTICQSDVLVPKWDPTVLFTPAGMNPFKDHFLGNVELEYTRATSCQKCLRTGDIENVGRTAYHHTFFEMLGNFSFGDYFKREAIAWAWEFLTDEKWLAIDPKRLTVTVYNDDDEAAGIWHKEIGLPLERISRLGEHDNFWPAGAPTDGPDGVCGPCSEIFYHPDKGGECEIWNLVFTQFNRSGDPPNNLSPLPSKNIDTGMGLERIAAVLQGVETNFHIDSLISIVHAAAEVCGTTYDADTEDGRRIRRITDHVRACTFAIHENVLPDAEKENYTVRRLLRRAVFQGRQMGMNEPFLYRIVPAVVAAMATPYPDLAQTADNVAKVIRQEEETFFKVIERGMKHVDRFLEQARAAGEKELDAQKVAHFYQTYGVPPELTTSVASELGMTMDWDKYQSFMDQHGKNSGALASGVMGNDGPIDELKQEVKSTPFVGYDATKTEAVVKGCGTSDRRQTSIAAADDETFIVLDATPFYARSGGQESDTGTIVGPSGAFAVSSMTKTGDLIVHYGHVTVGTISQGDSVDAIVDPVRRDAVCRAHSATHVLHHALQEHLGEHAQQRGSKVEADELRFDFANDAAVPAELLEAIEQQSNACITANSPVASDIISLAAAKSAGAMMLFGEKYPDPVRMVSIGEYSKELCGGTHVGNTSEIDAIEIVSEESVSAGVRRIVAYTGEKARANQSDLTQLASRLAQQLSTSLNDLPNATSALVKRVKGLRKQLSSGIAFEDTPPIKQANASNETPLWNDIRQRLRDAASAVGATVANVEQRVESMLTDLDDARQQIDAAGDVAAVSADDLIAAGESIPAGETPTLLVVDQVDGAGGDLLKRLVDQIRKKASPAAIVLGSATPDGKVLLVAGVSRDLVDAGLRAGDIVKAIAPVVGGGGGGKPDLAQAGGKLPQKLPEALNQAKVFIKEKLSAS